MEQKENTLTEPLGFSVTSKRHLNYELKQISVAQHRALLTETTQTEHTQTAESLPRKHLLSRKEFSSHPFSVNSSIGTELAQTSWRISSSKGDIESVALLSSLI